jgi:hypothetical protein
MTTARFTTIGHSNRYRHCPALGGRRRKQLCVDEKFNVMCPVRSFHNYADYSWGDKFAAAFEELVKLSEDRRLALMCLRGGVVAMSSSDHHGLPFAERASLQSSDGYWAYRSRDVH